MDAAVAGIPVSSPQPTQLTFEDGLGERRYTVGARQRAARSSETEFCPAVRCHPSISRYGNAAHGSMDSGMRSYGRVRSIEADRRTSALVVTSDYVAGIRLSTLLAETQKRGIPPEFNAVRTLVRQLVSAAAGASGSAPDVGNGAIAPERLVLTPAGRSDDCRGTCSAPHSSNWAIRGPDIGASWPSHCQARSERRSSTRELMSPRWELLPWR